MKDLKVIAFTHKQIDLKELGCLVLCNEATEERLRFVKSKFDIPEIFYLATCNRVEFVFTASQDLNKKFVRSFLEALHGEKMLTTQLDFVVDNALVFEQEEALNHLMRVASSLESLVVGEKEILAQVRKSYEDCRLKGFTGDYLRLLMSRVVKTELGGQAFELAQLQNFDKGFDVIITCTSAKEPIITSELYAKLLNGDKTSKVIVDLAIPNDVAPQVLTDYSVQYIEVESLKEIAEKNLQERYHELINGEAIIEQNIKERSNGYG